MIDNNSISSFLASNTIKTVAKTASVAAGNTTVKELAPTTANSDTATLSTLAKQLNDSAARADARDSGLGFKELGTLAKDIIDKVGGTSYYANRKLHDAEVPKTDDPALIERARQATEFANGTGKNPFAGLSQDQLRLVIYDEGGDYTVNERNAAYLENHDLEQAWKRDVTKRYVDEYNETGKSTDTLLMILAHYDELPPIEKAQYPNNYAANLASGDSSVLEALKTSSSSVVS
ncbi:hypothetical protein BW686_24120 [Pseudomonas syringae]|uniref:Uncharacterized protein n=1 Tax=Pseudomonas syringae TaxID=317 RepID=A0A244EKC0_PSESX|nr:hypothetical protein [Pseudomonas syringae]OUM04916.1 hypothetical protein BW686_24120 [Pseudomonas syringae]